jgi:VWFA-related protein
MILRRTTTFLFILLAVFSTVFWANAQTPTPTPQNDDDNGVETIFTEEVKLNVSAFDENGKFFSGVTKDDLVITEDGRLHQPTSVRRISANVLIVLDTGGEMRTAKNINQTRKTAESLVNSLKSDDSVALLQYNDKVEIISEWTNDKDETLNALKKQLNFGKRSLFLEAIKTSSEFLQKNPFENKHLVLITDGTDSFDRQKEIQEAMKNLLATNISVHVISYTQLEQEVVQQRRKSISGGGRRTTELPAGAGPPTQGRTVTYPILTINLDKEMIRSINKRGDDLKQSQENLAKLSKDTNGQFILPETKEEMTGKTGLISQMIDSSYVVTYTPKRPLKNAPKNEVREVVVTSKRAGLDLVAKRKITAPEKEIKQ